MKIFKYIILVLLGIFLAGIAGGCSQKTKALTGREGTRTVVDFTGTKLQLVDKPQRVVSFSISTDEIILDLLPPERIVGITELADRGIISNAVEKAKKIPNRINGSSPESLLKLKPDLIILPDFIKPEMIRTLREFGLPVYVYKTQDNLEDVRKIITDIGVLVGEEEKAQLLVENMDKRLATIQTRLKGIPKEKYKRVVCIRSNGVFYRKESSFNDICRYSGAINAVTELNMQQNGFVSKEQLVMLNPDAFVLVDYNYDGRHPVETQLKEILEDPAYRNTKAIKNKEIYVISGAHMLGLAHHIVYAIEDMAKALYPECFQETGGK